MNTDIPTPETDAAEKALQDRWRRDSEAGWPPPPFAVPVGFSCNLERRLHVATEALMRVPCDCLSANPVTVHAPLCPKHKAQEALATITKMKGANE